MRAVWYDRTGPAGEVLVTRELPDPLPAAGEVRVRVAAAGVNPRDVKRRAAVGDRTMADPRVIPGDDGAGIVDRVGPGVPAARIGQRVWVHSATYNRAFGTAAEYVVVQLGMPSSCRAPHPSRRVPASACPRSRRTAACSPTAPSAARPCSSSAEPAWSPTWGHHPHRARSAKPPPTSTSRTATHPARSSSSPDRPPRYGCHDPLSAWAGPGVILRVRREPAGTHRYRYGSGRRSAAGTATPRSHGRAARRRSPSGRTSRRPSSSLAGSCASRSRR